ncbi:protein of unknown function DUF34 [Pirellula staleyi DSM 6068]|uniref:GTP cyclohydrolase 1 type 2 homolog n=1 Tax=Pirellula staleyi (strain ATCC 27377 / DSM 6068 / ICPB 4128) TaxID=530564 RepID=D2R6E9_PIRSD|nr:Nif3-like dinuclear metal center hexameric protein [Pirellula staleyi]ADB15527.1 protein of unknown function DUF34 [Pirellula staleyi DSM 6068]
MSDHPLSLQDLCLYLEALAPTGLAESWDNVGLLMGDRAQPIARVMTCLTITPASAAEAIERQADLVIAHHPLPFRALKRITTDDTVGSLLWNLARHGVAIYSPHTALDSAQQGINAEWSARLELTSSQPLVPQTADPLLGAGRSGSLATTETLAQFITRVKRAVKIEHVAYVGQLAQAITRVAIACGSAGDFLPIALRAKCDALVTGEVNFHTALEAEARGIALVLVGHYASERFALETLATQLQSQFRSLEIWASTHEHDPIAFV